MATLHVQPHRRRIAALSQLFARQLVRACPAILLLLLLLQSAAAQDAVAQLTELVCGVLFAFGLVLAGMVRPTKVRRGCCSLEH